MKKFTTIFLGLAVTAFFIGMISYYAVAQNDECTTIQCGVLTYSPGHYLAGEPLQPGYDSWGYNYQTHLFSGSYANAYLGGYGYPPYEGDDTAYYQRLIDEEYAATEADAEALMNTVWCWPYRDVTLLMKWNDAWLSNKDCDGDGRLDRHYGHASYIGSEAWETNHQQGSYPIIDDKGKEKECIWNYFVKIVAVPDDAYIDAPYDIYGNGTWYAADGTEIGPQIWGSFAIIQQVYNDPCEGYHGIEYLSPAGPGFGKW